MKKRVPVILLLNFNKAAELRFSALLNQAEFFVRRRKMNIPLCHSLTAVEQSILKIELISTCIAK